MARSPENYHPFIEHRVSKMPKDSTKCPKPAIEKLLERQSKDRTDPFEKLSASFNSINLPSGPVGSEINPIISDDFIQALDELSFVPTPDTKDNCQNTKNNPFRQLLKNIVDKV